MVDSLELVFAAGGPAATVRRVGESTARRTILRGGSDAKRPGDGVVRTVANAVLVVRVRAQAVHGDLVGQRDVRVGEDRIGKDDGSMGRNVGLP